MKKRKKITRIVFFVLALVVAVTAFTVGVMSLTRRDSGYYDIDFTTEGNAVLYASGLHLTYYAEGSSSEIRLTTNAVQKSYTEYALNAFKLLDARSTYEGITNIASINASPGVMVKVSPLLFETLWDAYGRTNDSYSIFAGALHTQWEILRYLDDPESFDPLNDPDKRALMQKHAEWIHTPGAFDLEFDRENSSVKLVLSHEYLAWAQENEVDLPVLDLNVLHDAYLMQAIVKGMREAGYTAGFLRSDSGLYVYMEGLSQRPSFAITGLIGNMETIAAALENKAPVAFLRFTAFAPAGTRYGYYMIEQGGQRFYRHLYPSLESGDYRNRLMSLFLAGSADDLVSLSCTIAALNDLDAADKIRQTVSLLSPDVFAAYTLTDDPAALYIKPSQAGGIHSFPEKSSFTVHDLSAEEAN